MIKGGVSFNLLLDSPRASFAPDDPNQCINSDSKFIAECSILSLVVLEQWGSLSLSQKLRKIHRP